MKDEHVTVRSYNQSKASEIPKKAGVSSWLNFHVAMPLDKTMDLHLCEFT